MWPTEFKAFKNATCKNYGTNISSNVINSNEIKSTNVVRNNVKPSKSKITSKDSNYSAGKRGNVSNPAKAGIPAKGVAGKGKPTKIKAHENVASPHLSHPSSSPSPTLTQPVESGIEVPERP